jgi:hypothetical protein
MCCHPKSEIDRKSSEKREGDVLEDEEDLIKLLPHRPKRAQHEHTQHAECRQARLDLDLAQQRLVVRQPVVDPQRAVDEGAEEDAAAGELVDPVELLVAVARAEEEGEEGGLCGEEEDDRELGKGEEAGAVRVVE